MDHRLAKALSHPLRVRILRALEGRATASPTELAEELSESLGVVSYHVRRLHALGFIELARRTPRRGAFQHYYRAKKQLRGSTRVGRDLAAELRRADLLEHLSDVRRTLGGADAADRFRRDEAHLAMRPLRLDGIAHAQLSQEMDRLQSRAQEIAVASDDRMRQTDAPEKARTAGLVLLLAEHSACRDRPRYRGLSSRHQQLHP